MAAGSEVGGYNAPAPSKQSERFPVQVHGLL
jgi:hypothetical protein